MKIIPNFEELTKSLPKTNGQVDFHYTKGQYIGKKGKTYIKSYWSDRGFYQYQYDKLCDLLIPSANASETMQGELLRCISHIYYEFCNNGNGNALEQEKEMCGECNGSGWEEAEECHMCAGTGETYDDETDEYEPCCNCVGTGEEEQQECSHCENGYVTSEYKLEEFYEDMLCFLEYNLDSQGELIELREFLEDETRRDLDYTFDKNEMRIYDRVVDQVMHQILQSPILTPNPNYKPINQIK